MTTDPNTQATLTTQGPVAALVAAAGSGTRLGSGPKANLRLGERTLLEHTLAALTGVVDEVVVALPPDQLELTRGRSLAGSSSGAAAGPRTRPELAGTPLRYVSGGASRQESVRLMLQATAAAYVVVHDVARPFLPRAVLRRVIDAARRHGAASAALNATDTVVSAVDNAYGKVLDRERLRLIQTPQAFARELLSSAHARALTLGLEATDDAALVSATGARVELVAGSRLLLKITEASDLLLAEALLPRWLAREEEAA